RYGAGSSAPRPRLPRRDRTSLARLRVLPLGYEAASTPATRQIPGPCKTVLARVKSRWRRENPRPPPAPSFASPPQLQVLPWSAPFGFDSQRSHGGSSPSFFFNSGFSRNSVAVRPITCTTAAPVANARELATSFGLSSPLSPSFTFTSSRVRSASSSDVISDGVRPCW